MKVYKCEYLVLLSAVMRMDLNKGVDLGCTQDYHLG